uniref:Uncharacterized protein n=1 Tax=Morchella brunnea TaxID=1174671 RepID=A0A8K1MER9_9PEZI|nr:hypothetical protein LK370_mgp077 [Morchella brunnea]UBU98404.1 hypothetical protein [Morchella brunnea]
MQSLLPSPSPPTSNACCDQVCMPVQATPGYSVRRPARGARGMPSPPSGGGETARFFSGANEGPLFFWILFFLKLKKKSCVTTYICSWNLLGATKAAHKVWPLPSHQAKAIHLRSKCTEPVGEGGGLGNWGGGWKNQGTLSQCGAKAQPGSGDGDAGVAACQHSVPAPLCVALAKPKKDF